MSLQQNDLEILERLTRKNGDQIADCIGRAFERLEDKLEECLNDIAESLGDIQEEMRFEIRDMK